MTTAKRLVTGNEIVGGYALAGNTLCLGVYFSTLVGPGDAWLAVSRPFSILAALIVLKCTFDWGRLRGYPARRDDGAIAWTNVVRNLVMSAIVGIGVTFAAGPIAIVAVQLGK